MRDRTFLDALIDALDAARTASGGGAERPPAALLWPDEAGEWGPLVGDIPARLPVLTLGDYDAALRRGPAYWLRCVIDGAISIDGLDDGAGVLVVYLPGVGRSQLRAIEDAPAGLQPIAELQYRGAIFSQVNGRDWTIAAFLQAGGSGGLGLDVAGDTATKEAIRQARSVLGPVTLAKLRSGTPLKASFFHELLAPDLPRLVLEWLNDPQAFQAKRSAEEWAAFRQQFRQVYRLDLVEDGSVEVARYLGRRPDDAWETLWHRYSEAPTLYGSIPDRLRAARPTGSPKGDGLFDRIDSWPQVNEEEETRLRGELAALSPASPSDARSTAIHLEERHRERRGWVWARLDRAPLAMAIEPLTELAHVTAKIPNGADVGTIAAEYADWGWRADDLVMHALATVTAAPDIAAVETAVRALYADWLDTTCTALQKAVAAGGYVPEPAPEWEPGTCVIFSDGLRFDVGKRLAASLESRGLVADLQPRLTALPSVTGTAKPFTSPVAGVLGPGPGLDAAVSGGGPRVDVAVLRKQLATIGYQVLGESDTGDPSGRAWTELGNIDSLGHDQTAKLPRLLDGEVVSLAERIAGLLAAGWPQVAVVTDHGWLYLPGGLPKVEMPKHLTQDGSTRKPRCGRLEAGATTTMQTVPWTWDSTVAIAIPPGASSFEAGRVYEHGGVSPQECVTPLIVVRTSDGIAEGAGQISIAVQWRGLRATVSVVGAPTDATVDLRRKAGDPSASLLASPAALAEGATKLLVKDSDAEGSAVFVVVLGSSGNLVAQQTVTVGENA